MTSQYRPLAFELLERKASPSALLLALAPLEEPDQQQLESDLVLYATSASTPSDNSDLLKYIDQNTRQDSARTRTSELSYPTSDQALAADKMMQLTDTDLRSMLISEVLSSDGDFVYSVILF